jgi:hypothetical protein
MTAAAHGASGASAAGGLNTNGFFLEADNVTIDALGSAAEVGYRWTSTGTHFENRNNANGGSLVQLTDWHADSPSPPTGVEIRLDLVSGTAPTSGPGNGTWIDLTSPFSGSREWLLTGPPAITQSIWRVRIRDASGNVRCDANFSVTLDNSGPP